MSVCSSHSLTFDLGDVGALGGRRGARFLREEGLRFLRGGEGLRLFRAGDAMASCNVSMFILFFISPEISVRAAYAGVGVLENARSGMAARARILGCGSVR